MPSRFGWRHVSSWVIIFGVLVIAAAEVVDITANVPVGLERLYRADAGEPLELASATPLGARVVLKHCRDHGAEASDVG